MTLDIFKSFFKVIKIEKKIKSKIKRIFFSFFQQKMEWRPNIFTD